MTRDHFYLHNKTIELKLAMSSALAQSLKLVVLENRIEEVLPIIDEIGRLPSPNRMETRGAQHTEKPECKNASVFHVSDVCTEKGDGVAHWEGSGAVAQQGSVKGRCPDFFWGGGVSPHPCF